MSSYFVNPSLLSITKIHNRGSNAESVLNQNRRLILQLIKDSGVISRKTLTEKTGLKLATITLAIKALLEKGLIEEVGLIKGDSGRKIMGFSMSHIKYCVITLRMSTSYLKIGAYNLNNENLYIKTIFFDTLSDINHTCDVIVNEINQVEPHIKDRILIGIGLGVEGPFVIKDGYYKLPDNQSPEGYFDIGKVLNQKLGVPILINRQTNFAVYELWKREGKNNPSGIYVHISVSYTVECGIMVNGEIINGSRGTAGLLGNITIGQDNLGNPVTLQDEASSTAVIDKVRILLKKYPYSILTLKKDDLNIRDVIRAFTLEDDLAISIFTDVGIHLGRAVANLVNIFNPDYIFIGDELPTTVKMKNIIEYEAKKHLPKEVDPNLHPVILDYEVARDAKRDQSLLGGSSYIVDAFIQSMDFYN